MLDFLKVFVKGLVVTLLLPFILLAWILFAIYCFFVFIIELVKSIIVFFMGGSTSTEMKEDIEAKKILLAQQEQQNSISQAITNLVQNTLNTQTELQPQVTPSFSEPVETNEVPEISEENVND